MPDDELSAAEMQELKQIAGTLPNGHPAQSKVNLLLNSQPTQFERERGVTSAGTIGTPGGAPPSDPTTSRSGVSGALKSMLPSDPTEGRSPLDPKFWLNTDKSAFHPTAPGTAYSDLTRELPKDLPTNVLAGEKRGGQDSAIGRGIYRGASLFGPIAGMSAENAENASAKGDTAGVATQAAVPAALAIGVPMIKAYGPAMLRSAASRLVTPEGAPKPVPRLVLGGDRAQALAEIADPGPANARTLESKMGEVETARQQELADAERLKEQHAESLQRRGGEQQALDTTHEKQLSDIEKARQKELADQERLKVQHGQSLMKRGAEQEALDTEAAKQQESLGPKIVPPQAGVNGPRMTGSEGRAATWTNADVQRLAAQGNREAIQQATRRGLQLPPNARYVMGDQDVSRAVYNPRETTRFSPSGEPIRNVENPTEMASRSLIAQPEAATPQSAVREVVDAKTGEVTHPNERRASSAYDRDIFQKMINNPENSKQLSQSMKSVRSGATAVPDEMMGKALNKIQTTPGAWEKFTAADEAGRRKMLIDARNALQNGNGRMKNMAFSNEPRNASRIEVEGIDTPHSQESDRIKIDPFAKDYQKNLRKEKVKRA